MFVFSQPRAYSCNILQVYSAHHNLPGEERKQEKNQPVPPCKHSYAIITSLLFITKGKQAEKKAHVWIPFLGDNRTCKKNEGRSFLSSLLTHYTKYRTYTHSLQNTLTETVKIIKGMLKCHIQEGCCVTAPSVVTCGLQQYFVTVF